MLNIFRGNCDIFQDYLKNRKFKSTAFMCGFFFLQHYKCLSHDVFFIFDQFNASMPNKNIFDPKLLNSSVLQFSIQLE